MPGSKGTAVWALQGATRAVVSELAADCRAYNAVQALVVAAGASPSARLTILGAPAEQGQYTPLPDPANGPTITASRLLDLGCGAAFAKAQLSDVAGGQFSVLLVPWVSPGPTALRAEVGS